MRIPTASTQQPFSRPLRIDRPAQATPRSTRTAHEEFAFERGLQLRVALEKRHGNKAPKIIARLQGLQKLVPAQMRELDELKRQLNLPKSNARHIAAIDRVKQIKRARLEQARILRESGMNEQAMKIEEDVEQFWDVLLPTTGNRP